VKKNLTDFQTSIKYEPGKALYRSFYRKLPKIDSAKNVAGLEPGGMGEITNC
jgi:hypothetical protein